MNETDEKELWRRKRELEAWLDEYSRAENVSEDWRYEMQTKQAELDSIDAILEAERLR